MPETHIAQIYKLVEDNYRIYDRTAIKIILSSYFSSQIPALSEREPLWLVIIAPPASGKTELLRMFSSLPSSYWLSSLTQYSLISGDRSSDNSLLPRINGKVVLIKEMSTIDSAEKNKREEILGILRDAYDGFTSKEFAWGRREYRDLKFGFLGCATYQFEVNSSTRSFLGERFLSLRLRTGTLGTFDGVAEVRARLSETVLSLSKRLTQNIAPKLEENVSLTEKEKEQAQTAAKLRTAVPRNNYTKHIELIPPPDGANRLVMQLINLKTSAKRLGLSEEDSSEMVNRILLDYVPKNRLEVIRAITNGFNTVEGVAEHTHLGKTTAFYVLQDLRILGAITQLQRRGKITLSEKVQEWFCCESE